MNTAQLVEEAKQKIQEQQLQMYLKLLLERTEDGKFSFTWEAEYFDGTVIRQFDDITFLRAIRDPAFFLGGHYISTDAIERHKLKEFRLFPTALTRKMTPWFQTIYKVRPRPLRGEELVARWLVDQRVRDNSRIYRHVIGIRRDQSESLLVLSPTGSVVLTTTEDTSYDGE